MCVNRNCNEASDSDSHSHSNRNTHRQDTIQHDTSYELEPQPKQVAIRSAVYRATSKYQPTSMTTPRPRSHLHHIIRMSMLRSILLGGLLLSSATTRATFDAPSSNTNKKKEEVEGRGGGWHGRSLDAMPSSSWATMPSEEMEMELPMERRVFPLTTTMTTTTTSSSVARPRRQRVLQERELCSCSPPVFSIRLALSNDCSDDSLKANVGGIRGTLCLLGEVDGGGGDDGGGSDGGGGGGSGGGRETDMPTDMPTYFPTPFASQGEGGDDVPTILEPTAFPTTYRPTDPPMEVDDPFRPPVPPPAPPSDGNDGDSETIDVGGGENDDLDDGEDVIVDGGNGTATNINTNTTNETTNDDANDGTSETIDVGGGQTDDNVPSPTFAPSYPWPTYNPWPTFSPTSGADVAAKTIGADGTDTVTYAPSSPWPTFAPTADSKPATKTKAGTATSSVAGGTGTGSGSAPTPSSIERYYGYAPPGHHSHRHRRRDLIHVDRRDEGGEAEQDHEQTGEEEAEEVPREQRPRIVRHSDAIDGDHRHHDQRARIPHVDHPHDGWKGRDATRNEKKNDGDAPTTERHRQRRRQQQQQQQQHQRQQQQQQQQRRLPQHLSGTVADIESWASLPPNDEFFARFPEFRARQEELYRIRHGPSWRRLLDRDHLPPPHDDYDHRFRHLQENSTVPTQLVSAQFLEIDTSPDMNIINQDDQYLNLTSDDDDLVEIEDLSFTSVSSMLDPSVDIRDQLEYVPGGAILILIGRTDEGEIVRNRLLWTYTNGCGREDVPVFEGDEFGWAVFSDLEPAREEFCPASGAAPTPSTPSPTPSDSDMATPAPTAFSMDYYESGDERTRKLVEHMDLDGVRFSKRASSNDRPRRRRRSQPRPSRSGGENGSPTLMREVERSYGKEERRRRDVGLEREEFGRRILSPVLDTKEKKKEMTKKEKDLGEYHEEVEFGRHLKQRRLRKQERSS